MTDKWQHISFVFDGSKVEAYIDGSSIGSTPAAGSMTSEDKPFGVGIAPHPSIGNSFDGNIDEVSLWNKALTASEVSDIYTNRIDGSEDGLVLCYKFDQGYPGGNNTSIKKLVELSGNKDLEARLVDFKLEGNTSNFLGDLEPTVQAIGFPQIPNKVIVDKPFKLHAKATSGLDVEYEIESGPATVSEDMLTINCIEGKVIEKATQSGNSEYKAANPEYSDFQVIDYKKNSPSITIKKPTNEIYYVEDLIAIELAAYIDIKYDEVFKVNSVHFLVDDEEIDLKNWGNGNFTGLWTPDSYGDHTFEVVAINNYGVKIDKKITFEVKKVESDLSNQNAFDKVWLWEQVFSEEVEADLPSFYGGFDSISATLKIDCPTGGCDPWDRISRVEIEGIDGHWYEIIRYLTPYGIACSHNIDLTSFKSLLSGKVKFRPSLGTSGNGFLYTLNLTYHKGKDENPYSKVEKLWSKTYQFGDYANLQPCEEYNYQFHENTKNAHIKLVSTGHGWDINFNTGNAAEFHRDTHSIKVNGNTEFVQDNWEMCNPNPDGCNNQNGTWIHNRAGWCPGAIAPWFDFDMTSFIDKSNPVKLNYIFNVSSI